MNKDHLNNQISHMLEVPRSQIANFHYVHTTSAPAAIQGSALTTKAHIEPGATLTGTTINFLPINNNGIIDASIRGIGIASNVPNAAVISVQQHTQTDSLGHVFTTSQYGPLNMATNTQQAQQESQLTQNQQQIDLPRLGNITTTENFKYIEAGKHLNICGAEVTTSLGENSALAGTTMHVATGNSGDRITVKIDPIALSGRAGEQPLLLQPQFSIAPANGEEQDQYRIPKTEFVVIKEEPQHEVPVNIDSNVERILISHSSGSLPSQSQQSNLAKTASNSAVDKPVKPFKCSECTYETERKHRLKVHIMAIHTGEKPFKCSQCVYAAARKSTLKEHLQTIHSDLKPYECNECEYRTKKQSNLKVHMKSIHSNDKPFKCTECDYASALRNMLKKHVERFHSADAKSVNPMDCLKIGKTKLSRSSSSSRRRKVQPKQPRPEQQAGDEEQELAEGEPQINMQLSNDISSAIVTVGSENLSDKPHACSYCKFRTARRSNLKAHISTVHLKEKPFKCTECDFMTARRASLRTHLSSIHKVSAPTK